MQNFPRDAEGKAIPYGVHDMGSQRSVGVKANQRGTPLTTYETIVDRIGNTRTAEGLRVRAELDDRQYPTGVTVTKKQMNAMALVPDEFHGEWNYKLE